MSMTKRALAFVVVLLIVMSIVQPTNMQAAKSIYEYEGVTIMAGQTAPFVPEMCNEVNYTTGKDYGTVVSVSDNDPYFTIDMTDVTLNGKILAIKYRLSYGTTIENSFLYPETTAGGWGENEAGVLKTDKMTSSGEWQLVTYNIDTELLGSGLLNASDEQLSATIKSLRISCGTLIDSTFDIAYAGTFDTVAEAENYDAMFSEIYTTVDTNYKVEVVPASVSAVTRYFYNLNDSGVADGASLYNTAYKNSKGTIINPIKNTWTVNFGTNSSKYVVSGVNKYLHLQYDSIMSSNRYNNNVSYVFSADVLPGDMANHFSGFVFNFGYENDARNNIFFESNRVNKEASVAKSGIGVSVYPTYMEVYIVCVDENTGELSQITQSFPFETRIDDNFHSFKAVDNAGGIIRFYLDEVLIASVSYSKDKVPTGNATSYSERYYREASIYDGEGNLLKQTSIALISYTKAVAMGSRARYMKLDNICLEPTDISSATLSLDKQEYEANSKLFAMVSFNHSPVVNGFIGIYNIGDKPGEDSPLIVASLGQSNNVNIDLMLDPGNYFAAIMGVSGTKHLQYGKEIDFKVIKTEKSFIIVEDKKAEPGTSQKVTISIPENQGITYIALRVNYDKQILTLTNAKSGQAFDAAIFTSAQSLEKNPYIITWASASNITKSGVLAELSFDISAEAEGSSEISVEVIEVFSSKYAGNITDVTSLYLPDSGIIEFVESDEVEEKPLLKVNGAFVRLANDVSISFYVYKSDFDKAGYDKPVLNIMFGGQLTTIEPIEEVVNSLDSYVFEFKRVRPYMFGDNMRLTLYAELKGTVCASESIDYSVSKYLYRTLEKAKEQELKTLLVDLLRYGAAVQQYMNYNVDNLVDAKLTAEQASYGTQVCRPLTTARKIVNINEATIKWKSAALLLKYNIEMKVSFVVENTSGLYVKVMDVDDKVISIITEDEFMQEFDITGKKSISVTFEGIKATELSKICKFAVFNSDGEQISDTLVYSAESYAYSKQNSESSLANLVKRLIMYGDSAFLYFNKNI